MTTKKTNPATTSEPKPLSAYAQKKAAKLAAKQATANKTLSEGISIPVEIQDAVDEATADNAAFWDGVIIADINDDVTKLQELYKAKEEAFTQVKQLSAQAHSIEGQLRIAERKVFNLTEDRSKAFHHERNLALASPAVKAQMADAELVSPVALGKFKFALNQAVEKRVAESKPSLIQAIADETAKIAALKHEMADLSLFVADAQNLAFSLKQEHDTLRRQIEERL